MSTSPRVRKVPGSSRRLLITLVAASLLLACGGPPPRPPNPTRPLDERRAVEIIIQGFHDERDRPVPGQPIQLATPGKHLKVDVGSEGHRYGVAYVTEQERLDLGAALEPRDPNRGDVLTVVSGVGADANARVLLLHDTDYLYDDHVGEQHEETTVTAELKLRRDVRDFIVKARAEKWP